jgi:hypothetical protein
LAIGFNDLNAWVGIEAAPKPPLSGEQNLKAH